MPNIPGLVLTRDCKAQGNCNARVGTVCETVSSTMGRPRRKPFMNPVRCKMSRGAPAHLRSLVTLFLVPDYRAGGAAAQLNELML